MGETKNETQAVEVRQRFEAEKEREGGQNVVFIHQSELSAAMELWKVPLHEGGGLLT